MAGGDFAYGAPHETKPFRSKARRLSAQANQNMDDRIGIGQFASGVSQDQRNWSDLNIRPIERALSQSISNRIGGDQTNLIQSSQQGVFDAYDNAQGSANRSASRYGVNIDDPSLARGTELDRTKNAIQSGNIISQSNRDNALRDAGQFYQSGAGLPGQATQQYIAGAGSMADQNDFSLGQKYGDLLGKVDAQKEVGMGFANAFNQGGIVRGNFYAEGGSIDETRQSMGGRPGMTAKLRNQFDYYNLNAIDSGETPKDWKQWLDGQGYTLENDNLVQPKQYAEGGNVNLTSGDFMVPSQAVEFYGQEFWDKLVSSHGGDISGNESNESDSPQMESNEPGYRQGGIVGYAGGGGVGVGFGSGLEQGYGSSLGPAVGALKTGLTSGLLDARATEEHDARMKDNETRRGYEQQDRAYLNEQRTMAQKKQALDTDLQGAMTAVSANDGTDWTPLFNVQKKHFPSAGTAQFIPNPDGKTYKAKQINPDGTVSGKEMNINLDQYRKIGVAAYKTMEDPKSFADLWKQEVKTSTTPYGGITSFYDEKTGKEIRRIDNERLSADGSGGGSGNSIMGWKNHQVMTKDINALAFKRFAVPNPNGMGSFLDPQGQMKAQLFRDKIITNLGGTNINPRDVTSDQFNTASSEAETAVNNEFLRRGAKKIKGAGAGWTDFFDADKAAADMANYFPTGGDEREMRTFMAQHSITNKADQDQVIEKLNQYIRPSAQTAQGAGIGQAAPSISKSMTLPPGLPPGTVTLPDGTFKLPNGQIVRPKK